jgi:hypothetical protein
MTTKRHIEKKWEIDYEEFVKKEQHINNTKDIITELKKHFEVKQMFGLQSFIPLVDTNLLIFIKCRKR